MSNAHADAPVMDEAARKLYRMVRGRAPVYEIYDLLSNEFNAKSRLLAVPTYKQPNGFWTFKLGGESGKLLRLHFWPAGLAGATETSGVHDHTFDFTSLVLAGSRPMINTHFLAQQDPASKLAIYEVDYANPQEQVIRKLGDHFKPVAARRDYVPPGNSYNFPAGVFHTSRIQDDAEAITLMATEENPAIARPRFFAAADLKVQPLYARVPLTQGERAFVIDRLRAAF